MKFNPFPYQWHCIDLLIRQPAVGLFLEMGLGKTVVALSALNDLRYNKFQVSKALVIAPKKVAEGTWALEAEKWDHLKHLKVSTVMGTQQQRIRALCQPADLYVINRDNVRWLVDYYRNAWPFDFVIIDELTSFKSADAKRFKELAKIRPHIRRIVGLTGTPSPNGLMDLWAQVYLLDCGQRLYDTIGKYRERYFHKIEMGVGQVRGYEVKSDAEAEIHNRIKDICISMKAEDYIQLPEIMYQEIPVVLDSKAQATYERMEREAVLEFGDQVIDASTAAVLTNKLLQLCNGAAYSADRQVVQIHDNKLEAFLETLEGLNGQPALVFYSFQHDRDRILAALTGTDYRVRVYKDLDDQKAWNRREIDVLLAHPASAAYGLNLQDGGNHVIWFGLNWSLELYQQANKRLHRQGQTQRVIVHHLVVKGGADEDVLQALTEKGATQDRLMLALKARIERVRSGAA